MKKISRLTLLLMCCLTFSSHANPENKANSYYNPPVVFSYNIETRVFGKNIGTVEKREGPLKESFNVGLLYDLIEYNFVKKNDSVYIEELSVPDEKYVYKKREGSWKLINYSASGDERPYKKDLEGKFKTNSLPLAEISRKHLNPDVGDTIKFFLLGNEYKFYKKSENTNFSKFKIEGIDIDKRDETEVKEDNVLFNNEIKGKFRKGLEVPYKFRVPFEVKRKRFFSGEYAAIGKLDE